jgi:RNA polymerase sigma factor (sigma-70 family)
MRRELESFILYVRGLRGAKTTFWNEFAICDGSPRDNLRAAGLEDARKFLTRFKPEAAASPDVRAFQIVFAERGVWVRVNHEVQGTLTVRLRTNPENPRRPHGELEFTSAPDEQPNSATYVVFQHRVGDRVRAIVTWDALTLIIREQTAARIQKKVRMSLPAGGPRLRWMALEQEIDAEEVVSAFYEEGLKQPTSNSLAFRVLERIEESARAGKPSRRTDMAWVPLHATTDTGDELDEGEQYGLASPEPMVGADVNIDLDRALMRLPSRAQEIVGRYYAGETDQSIAQDLGISQQAVYAARQKALKKLAEIMSN